MSSEPGSRSRWSTALVSLFGGPFGGFLWIGAGRAAIVWLIVVSLATIAVCYVGLPVLPGTDLAWLARFFHCETVRAACQGVLPFHANGEPPYLLFGRNP